MSGLPTSEAVSCIDVDPMIESVSVHGQDDNKFDTILRRFDMTTDYGPYVGITRLERWERAQKLGKKPSPEVCRDPYRTQPHTDLFWDRYVKYCCR